MTPPASSARTLDNLRKEAKRWLRALRSGEASARRRLESAHPAAPATPTLRDVQHALALERGFEGWTDLKRSASQDTSAPENAGPIRTAEFESDRPYGPWASRGSDVWDAIFAARAGDVASLRGLLERDVNLSKYSEPLHFAVREGHAEAVQVLLDAGADPDVAGSDREPLIVVARDRGHEAVAALLENVRSRRVPQRTRLERRSRPRHSRGGRGEPGCGASAGCSTTTRRWRTERSKRSNAVAPGGRSVGSRRIRLLVERGANIQALHGHGPADDEGYAPVDFHPIDLALFWRRPGRFRYRSRCCWNWEPSTI